METIFSIKPLLAILVSIISTFLILWTGKKKPNLREFWSVGAGVLKFLIVASMAPAILDGKTIEYTLFHLMPGVDIKFRVDAFGILFALGASFLWIITTFYSIGYMRSLDEHAQTRYFACFAISLSTTMGVAFSANLFTMFLFYEGLTLITYPLVAHKETDEARAGARKYAIYLLGAAKLFLVAAIILTYNLAGTLEFAEGGLFSDAVKSSHGGMLSIMFLLYVFGFAKCAIMPLHGWLPAAMVAPTPVSALLHAVAVVKTGVFSVLRVVFFVFGVDFLKDIGINNTVVFLASFTIVMASVIALSRDNLKARLAYSTVSQLSYIILGAVLLTPSAITGSLMHIVLHAFGKITLFFTAGAIYVATHKTLVSELDGIGRRMPFTMGAFTVGALSMIGVPPLGGFLSKWYLGVGAMEAGQLLVLGVLALSTLLNAGYFLPIIYAAFFKESKDDHHADAGHTSHHEHNGEGKNIREAPIFMVAALVFTAVMSALLFFTPSVFLELAKMVVVSVTGGK